MVTATFVNNIHVGYYHGICPQPCCCGFKLSFTIAPSALADGDLILLFQVNCKSHVPSSPLNIGEWIAGVLPVSVVLGVVALLKSRKPRHCGVSPSSWVWPPILVFSPLVQLFPQISFTNLLYFLCCSTISSVSSYRIAPQPGLVVGFLLHRFLQDGGCADGMWGHLISSFVHCVFLW